MKKFDENKISVYSYSFESILDLDLLLLNQKVFLIGF